MSLSEHDKRSIAATLRHAARKSLRDRDELLALGEVFAANVALSHARELERQATALIRSAGAAQGARTRMRCAGSYGKMFDRVPF